MFAFSTIEPNARGYLDKPPIPLSRFLGAAWDQGVHDSMGASIYRISEQLQLQGDLSLWGLLDQQAGRMMSPDEASAQYGTTRLRFTEPVREGVAKLLRDRHDENERRNYLLSEGASSKSRIAGSFGVSMLGSLSNPVDFALMFFPAVGSETTAAKLGALGAGSIRRALARGLVTEESIARVLAPKVLAAAIDGVVGQAIAEVPLYISNRMDQTPYTLADSATNIALGGVFAAGVRLALTGAGRLFKKLSGETREAITRKAVTDFLSGKEPEVHKLVELDEAVIRERVLFDEVSARTEATLAVDKYVMTELRNQALYDLGLDPSAPRVDQPNLVRIAEDWIPIFEKQGKDVTILSKLLSTVRDGAPTLIDFENLARQFDLVFDPMERKFPAQYYLAPDPERARMQRIAGVRDEDLKRPGQVSNEQRRQQATQLEAERKLRIQERVDKERERTIRAYVESLRREFDPQKETRRRVNEETLRQQKEGRLLTEEQAAKYAPSDVADDTDVAVLEKDVEELKKILEIDESTAVDTLGDEPTAVDHIVATLEKLKMDVGDGKTPRLYSGVPPEIWNTFIDLVIKGVRLGGRLYQVVNAIIDANLGLSKPLDKKQVDFIREKFYDSTSELRPAAMLSPSELRAEAKPAIIASVSEKGVTARGRFHGIAYENLSFILGEHFDYDNNWDYMRGREGFITVNQRHVTREEMQALVGESESFAMALLKDAKGAGDKAALIKKKAQLKWEQLDLESTAGVDASKQRWLQRLDMELREVEDQLDAIDKAEKYKTDLDKYHATQLELHVDVSEPVNKEAWDKFYKEPPAGYEQSGAFYVPNGKKLSDGLSEKLLLDRLRGCIIK